MNKKYIKIIFIISILLTILVLVIFIFFFRVIKNKNEHVSKVLTTLTEKIKDKENREILMNKFAELESISESVNNFFIDPSKIDTFVGYLEKLGTDNNTELVVKNVEIEPKKKDSISIKVLISGEFSDVMSVVYLLENIPHYTSLNQIFVNKVIKTNSTEIDGVEKTTEISLWQADVSFNVIILQKK